MASLRCMSPDKGIDDDMTLTPTSQTGNEASVDENRQ